MAKLFNNVGEQTTTTGTGTITLAGDIDESYTTFAEAGAVDGNVITYKLSEGDDFEIGRGTIGGTVTTLSRDTVLISKIGGTVGTTKMTLGGAAEVRVVMAAEDRIEPPASSVDNAIVRFDGTVGSVVQNSAILVSDVGGLILTDFTNTTVKYHIYSDEISGDDRLIITSTDTPFGTRVWFDTPNDGSAFSLAVEGAEKIAFGHIVGDTYGITLYDSNFAFRDGDASQVWFYVAPDVIGFPGGQVLKWSTDSQGNSGEYDVHVYRDSGGNTLIIGTGTGNTERLRINDSGVNPSVRIIENEVNLTDGATVALNAALGNTFKLVAGGNRTISVPTNKPASGKVQKIVIMHEASGGARTLTLTTGSAGAFRFGTDITALSATASGTTDYIGCIYDDTDDRWDVVSYCKGF